MTDPFAPQPRPGTAAAGGWRTVIRPSDVLRDAIGVVFLIFGMVLPWTRNTAWDGWGDGMRDGSEHAVIWVATVLSLLALAAATIARGLRLVAGAGRARALAIAAASVRALSLLPYAAVTTFILVLDLIKWDDAFLTGGAGLGLGFGLAGATLIAMPGRAEAALLPRAFLTAWRVVTFASFGFWLLLASVAPLARLWLVLSHADELHMDGGDRASYVVMLLGTGFAGAVMLGLLAFAPIRRSDAARLAATIAGALVVLAIVVSWLRGWRYGPANGMTGAYEANLTLVMILALAAFASSPLWGISSAGGEAASRLGAARGLLLATGLLELMLAVETVAEISGVSAAAGWSLGRSAALLLTAIVSLVAAVMLRRSTASGKVIGVVAAALGLLLGIAALFLNMKRFECAWGSGLDYRSFTCFPDGFADYGMRPALLAMHVFIPLAVIVLLLIPAKVSLSVEGLRTAFGGGEAGNSAAAAPAVAPAVVPSAEPVPAPVPVPVAPLAAASPPPPPEVAVATPAHPRAAEAADPSSSAAVLYDIAVNIPELRAAVAANPSAYPDLLEWLGKLGDPAVNAAIAAR